MSDESTSSGATPLLHCEGVSKSFGAVQALYKVDFDVRAGETLGIVGVGNVGRRVAKFCGALGMRVLERQPDFALLERGLREANIGINPSVDGPSIRLPIPEMNKERRMEMCKRVKVMGEEGKVRVPGGLLKLRVIEVKESSATINIDGESTHRELRLRDGVADKLSSLP